MLEKRVNNLIFTSYIKLKKTTCLQIQLYFYIVWFFDIILLNLLNSLFRSLIGFRSHLALSFSFVFISVLTYLMTPMSLIVIYMIMVITIFFFILFLFIIVKLKVVIVVTYNRFMLSIPISDTGIINKVEYG